MLSFLDKNFVLPADSKKVWQSIADVAATPNWIDGVQASEITSDAKEGVGLSWKEKSAFGKQAVQMDHEITIWEPNKKIKIHSGLPMGGSMDRTMEFTEKGNETEVKATLEWDMGIVGSMIGEDKLRHMLEKSFDQTIANWQKLLA